MRLSRALAAAAGALVLYRVRPLSFRDLRGKVVLITGGTRGLGLLMARRFGEAGAKLAICSRDRDEVRLAQEELLDQGCNVFATVCDLSVEDEARRFVDHTVEKFGRLDIVVNNAGIIQVAPIEALDIDDFATAVDSNFWSAVYVTMAAVPHLKKQRQSRIVNITSIGAALSVPHLLPYCSAKFAMLGFSTGLHAELAKDGIRVVTILPGLMRTGSFLNAFVKGDKERETSWFSLGASLPGLSMSADRAASRIVLAASRGEPFVTLGLPAKVARLAVSLAPNLVLPALAIVNAVLPKAPEGSREERATKAAFHREGVARSRIMSLGDRNAERNNELTGLRPDQLH